MEIMSNKEALLIRELRDTTSGWTKGDGPLNHIVVSTRLRLARNIQDIPFPFKANPNQLEQVLKKSENLIKNNSFFQDFKLIKIDDLTDLDIQFLVEKRLISLSLAQLGYPYRAFIYKPDEIISIMVNEEDHFRIQCLLPGFQLEKVWEIIDCYDDQIMKEIEYSFNENEGFLTCCPTNAGTGLRASVMLHLPGLFYKNKLNDLLSSISKTGYAVRGFYGEGTDFQGNLFQVSNQVTMGLKENEIIKKLEMISRLLIDEEERAREELMLHSRQRIEDQILRAYGILTNARIISTLEAIDLLSKIRFGIELGIFTKIGYDTINRLMLIIQSAYIQLLKNKKMNENERDIARAKIIQELLD
ncbi:MAG: protein arginine kinase [Atribacterota bacterium]|jgi:protein arginine kinase|nr:protein arginine kinase [Atribacterota bacterium]